MLLFRYLSESNGKTFPQGEEGHRVLVRETGLEFRSG